MEDLATIARAAEQQVLTILKKPDEPIRSVLASFNEFRPACQNLIFANFQNADGEEARLWQAHSEGRKYFHNVLSNLRKKHAHKPVETRELMKLYLDFLKQSIRFYREYIYKLSTTAGGIPELEEIAQRVKRPDDAGESLSFAISPAQALASCHRSLVYLGDLYRYRASEGLDKKAPDYGPAIGYYGLAATLIPSSGLGHHQQAVVALEQRQHLRAIYHLYRSLSVDKPHPQAFKNLCLQMDKTMTAWDKGELIQKGLPNEPDHPKHVLIGWFVRLHSICFKGESYKGYDELEREVLAQLTSIAKQRSLGDSLMRMIIVNITAQFTAGERFRDSHGDQQEQDKLLHLCRFNLKFFTTLLQIFYDDLRAKLLELDDPDAELEIKLTPVIRRLLPYLRVYNNWLLPNMTVRMIGLLGNYPIADDAVQQFWPMYARVIDLIAQAFPIWDLEDMPEVTYMLEEDVDTLGLKPLWDDEQKRTLKTWCYKDSGAMKQRFSASNLVRRSTDDEDLHRIKSVLADGLFLANDDEDAPIHLRQTRIFFGDESQVEPLIAKQAEYSPPKPIAPPIQEKPKVVSYATAAANGHARQSRPSTASQPSKHNQAQSREAQLTRMVDDLLDDDNATSPPMLSGLPPLPPTSPAANANIEANNLRDSAHELPKMPDYSHGPKRHSAERVATRSNVMLTPPAATGPTRAAVAATPNDIQRLWADAPPATSPSYPSGTLGSPALFTARGHSRVNSASSIRSKTSQSAAESPDLRRDSAPRILPEPIVPGTVYGKSAYDQPGVHSPLLFGAGDSLWSPSPRGAFGSVSPPGSHGG